MRRGFTLIEVAVFIALVTAIAGVTVPLLRNFLIRSDLYTTAEQTKQKLRQAQILSQSGNRGNWGVYPRTGTLYQGTSFLERDLNLDEISPISPNIHVSGIEDVNFSAMYGKPSETGSISLTAINGDKLTIDVHDSFFDISVVENEYDEVAIKLSFLRIKNTGDGSAEPTVHVGSSGELYQENIWIPLTEKGIPIVDDGFMLGAAGVAVKRSEGAVYFFTYGGLPLFQGIEIVDVRISIKNAVITDTTNGSHPDRTEFPFDGHVFDWSIGDEITLESNTDVLFQARVTNESDSFHLLWE